MTATATLKDAAALDGPYLGLTFYAQENAALFFGRDDEQAVLISNLRASRLTLLYAESGAGKSSVLRAGVAAKLAELAWRNIGQRGAARYIPIVFSSWRDEPTEELIAAVQQTTMAFQPQAVRAQSTGTLPNVAFDMPRAVSGAAQPSRQPTTAPGRTPVRLNEAIAAATSETGATLLVMLDQFEEYFLYRSREARDDRFADELAACINQADVRANFLISIREDAYSGLGDLFQGRIRNVYSNYLHLEHLTREAAREAIEKPIASFNKLHHAEEPAEIEPGLADVILGQLGSDQFTPGQGGIGRLAAGNGADRERGEIAAPYLQLVMKRLWETEVTRGSRTLRRATLDDLGGAQTIVRTHVDHALGDLPEEDREAAVDIFHHLVTPSGTKIALTASDLAEYTGRPAEEASALLERLAGSDIRILRPVPPPPGQEGGTRYEISHDLLAPVIQDWGRRQRAARLEHEKDSAQRQARSEKRRAGRFRDLALALALVLLVAVGILAYFVQNARNQAESRAMAARAESMLSQDPGNSARLALQALNVSTTAEAQSALRDALPQLQLKATLAPPPPMRSAAFSGNGTKILTAAANGTIRIFDAATGTQLTAFAGAGPLNSAAFSRNGTRIVTANDDGTARILDASSGKVTGVLTPPGGNGYPASSAAFSPDGTKIVTTYADGIARIWDARTGRLLHTLTGDHFNVLLGATFSPDGKFVITASSSGHARIYDASTGAQVHVLSAGSVVESAAFSPNGKYVVTVGGGGRAQIWNVTTGMPVAQLAAPSYRYGRSTVHATGFSAAFSPDGRRVVTAGSDGVARIWDAATGQLIRKLGVPNTGSLQAAAYSPDGRSVVTASADGVVRVWDSATGKPVRLLAKAGGISPLRSAVFSPDGKWAATGSQYGTVTIWQAPAAGSRTWTPRNVISAPEGDAVNGMAFSPNGKLLVTANQSGNAYAWLVPSGLPWEELSGRPGQPLNTVAFDAARPDWVVTAGDDGYARIFSISNDIQVGALKVPGWDMTGAAFSPDGSQIVTVSNDGYGRIWNPATWQQISKFGYGVPMSSVGFSANGKQIATTENAGYSIIWDATSNPPKVSSLIAEPGNSVPHDAAFSPDGSLLVTAGSDGTAREWSVATQNQVLLFGTSSGLVSTVAFGGNDVITASSDGTAKIWDAEPAEQQALLPSGTDRPIYTSTFSRANPRIVATAYGNETVSVWNTSDPAHLIATLSPAGSSAEFSADGKLLVTAGNQQVRIWRTNSLSRPAHVFSTRQCENHNVTAAPVLDYATFSPDGTLVVTSENDGTACVWNVSTGALVQKFTEPQGVSGGVAGGAGTGGSAMHRAVFSPSGKLVLTADHDGTARIWDVRTGRQLRAVSEPTGQPINAAWFSPDGKLLVTASDDGTARIWDAGTGRLLHTLRGPGLTPVHDAAFSPNGRRVVTCSGSAAVIWSTAGQQLTELQHGNALYDCQFSPDNSQVVTAGVDGYTRIFSTELAGSLAQLEQIAKQRLHMAS